MPEKVLVKKNIKYNVGGSVSDVKDKSKAVKFLAINNGLKIHYYVQEDIPLVGITKTPQGIQFQNMYFETDNETEIAALRICPSFGGSKAENFKNRVDGYEDLFYEGDYPEDIHAKMEKESQYITNVEGTHEQLKEERFTSIDRLN